MPADTSPFKHAGSTGGKKTLDYDTIELDDVKTYDYPDFCDAYAVYAEWTDGTPLNEQELEAIPSDVIHDRAHEEFH